MPYSNTTTVQTRWNSPLGHMRLAARGNALAGIWFEGQRHQPDPSAWPVDDRHPVLLQAVKELTDYFAGKRKRFDLPLDLDQGTPFQQAVWQTLRQIPLGASMSYGDLAQSIGRPSAVRAVGAAVGRNPLCIVVPCHRVLGKNGALTGYAAGLERKVALLRLEGTPFRIGSPQTD